MNRRVALGVLIAAALVVVAGGLWFFFGRGQGGALPGLGDTAATAETEGKDFLVTLYFPGPNGLLVPERRTIQATSEPKDRVAKIVAALLAGPEQDDLVRPFPEGTEVGSVQITAGGAAYIDLRSASLPDPPPTGSTGEMQMVFSIVHSVAANVEQAPRVALLWNGVQRVSFGGHLDTSRPLYPDRSLLGE